MLISVVIPTKDRSDVAVNAVASIYAGSFDDFELFVVDQSVGFETKDKMLSAFSTRSGFHYVANRKPGVGAASSRNIGIALSTGEIIAVADDDVTARPDWLANIAREFEADPDLHFICGKLTAPPFDWTKGYTPSFDAPVDISKYRMPIDAAGANFSMRRSLFDKIGGYDEWCGPGSKLRASDDGDIAWRIVRSGAKWKACPHIEVEHTFGFRDSPDGKSLLQRYQLGIGGNFGRFVRRGDLFAAAYFYQWQFNDTVHGIRLLMNGRGDNGLGWVRDRIKGFFRGVMLPANGGFVRGDDFAKIREELSEAESVTH